MTAQVQHLECKCGYTRLCPWDRFCASCGTSLGSGFSVTEKISVGRDKDAISVVLENKSQVAITVHAPPIFQFRGVDPPDWLDYSEYAGGEWIHTLRPSETRVVQYKIRRAILEEMLQDGAANRSPGAVPDAAARAVQFELLVCSNADYTRQDHVIRLSLSGQADLRPARLEFPLIPLHAEQTIDLPFQAYNASGQSMSVHAVEVSAVSTVPPLHGDDTLGRMITDLLFPADVFADLRERKIGPGETVDLKVTSRPVAEALESFIRRQDAPIFDDPYWGTDRFKAWYWRWPTLTRLRFVVEAKLRSDSGDDNSVRSLVVMTLVRPPNLMDATPEDALWKVVSGPGGQAQVGATRMAVTGEGTLTAIADITNDSAIPVFVDQMVSTVPWMTVTDAPFGKLLAPGQETFVKVEIDPSKRGEEDLQQQDLTGYIRVISRPPLLEDCLEAVNVKTSSTLVVPGCLGIDFGTSNCSVCFLPSVDTPGGSPIQVAPVELSLEQWVGEKPKPGMPSVLWRRYTHAEQSSNGEFAFGSEAASLWQSRPSNVRRAIKRILATPQREHAFEDDNDARPVVRHSTRTLAELMIGHVIREAQRLAASDTLRSEVLRLAKQAETDQVTGFPSPDEVNLAQAFRFERAVFTHPVEASDELRKLLFGAAQAAGLAHRKTAEGGREPHTFESFESDCMVDEATAAMTAFVDKFKDRLAPPRRRRRRGQDAQVKAGVLIVCLDIGGGTTDISVMHYEPDVLRMNDEGRHEKRSLLHLLNRAGINDFAGEDIDLRIVEEILVPALNQKLSKPHKGAVLMAKQFQAVLRGAATSQIENSIEQDRLASSPEEIASLAASVVKGSHLLREAAEELKKAAGAGGERKITLAQMPPFLVGNQAFNGADLKSVVLTIDLGRVGEVIRGVVSDRLALVDRAVEAANKSWTDIDALLFTGQTTRSFDVRSAVLDHVWNERRAPLKFLIVPPSDAGSSDRQGAGHGASSSVATEIAETVLEFDPKVCVPGGAAIYGAMSMKADRLQVLLSERSGVALRGSNKKWVRKGTPLPVIIEVDLHEPEASATCFATYDVDSEPMTVPLPGLPDSVMVLSLVLGSGGQAFLVGSPEADEEPEGSQVSGYNTAPPALSAAVASLKPDLVKELQLGPNRLWWMPAPLNSQEGVDEA